MALELSSVPHHVGKQSMQVRRIAALSGNQREQLFISCDRSDGIVMHVRGYTAVETIGTARLGNLEGFSNLEVCTNAAGGHLPPLFAIGANLSDGLSRR